MVAAAVVVKQPCTQTCKRCLTYYSYLFGVLAIEKKATLPLVQWGLEQIQFNAAADIWFYLDQELLETFTFPPSTALALRFEWFMKIISWLIVPWLPRAAAAPLHCTQECQCSRRKIFLVDVALKITFQTHGESQQKFMQITIHQFWQNISVRLVQKYKSQELYFAKCIIWNNLGVRSAAALNITKHHSQILQQSRK